MSRKLRALPLLNKKSQQLMSEWTTKRKDKKGKSIYREKKDAFVTKRKDEKKNRHCVSNSVLFKFNFFFFIIKIEFGL